MEEQHAEVRAGRHGRGEGATVHVGVAARLVHQGTAQVVEVVAHVPPAVEDGRAGQLGQPAGDDPQRLARGVRVERRQDDLAPAHVPAGPVRLHRHLVGLADWRSVGERVGRGEPTEEYARQLLRDNALSLLPQSKARPWKDRGAPPKE